MLRHHSNLINSTLTYYYLYRTPFYIPHIIVEVVMSHCNTLYDYACDSYAASLPRPPSWKPTKFPSPGNASLICVSTQAGRRTRPIPGPQSLLMAKV